MLLLIPHSTVTKARSRRSHDEVLVLTSSPYVQELQEHETKRSLKMRTTAKSSSANRGLAGKNPVKDVDQKEKKSCRKLGQTKEIDNDEDDPNCPYCDELYSESRPKDMWVRCTTCNIWAHDECEGIRKSDKFLFVNSVLIAFLNEFYKVSRSN